MPVLRAHGATNLENVGFVPANIWYSTDSPKEGETIRIYTFIFNNSTGTLTGTAEFFDSNTTNVTLGKKTFSLPSQTSKDIYINWKATPGDHVIHAEISDAKVTYADGKIESVSLENNKTTISKIFVPKSIVIPPKTDTAQNNLNKPMSEIGTSISLDSLSNILPENVSTPIKESLFSLDSWREDKLLGFKDLKESSKQNIDKIKAPWEYVKYFFAMLMSFVFGNKLIFYIVIFGLAILIIRFFWRKAI